MKPTNETKYPVFKSIHYMLKMAWDHQKSVLVMCLVIAATQIGLNLAQLYIAPKILEKVELSVPLGNCSVPSPCFPG